MAKSTYRLYSAGRWQAMSGNAIMAITNQVGSAKKITVESVEINPLTYNAAGGVALATAQIPTIFDVGYCAVTAEGSVGVVPIRVDTATTAWSSDVTIRTASTVSSVTPLRRIALCKALTGGGVNDMVAWSSRSGAGARSGSSILGNLRGSSSVPLTVRPGESLCVNISTGTPLTTTLPLRVKATLSLDYATEAFYTADVFVVSTSSDQAVLTIKNAGTSGRIVRVLTLAVEEVGTWDSPYFRMVPVGALDASAAADTTFNLLNGVTRKLDSSSPALNAAQCRVWQDVPMLPLGVPQSYISEGSAGTPKGYNYLHTKDFDGPQYATLFPEFLAACGANIDGAAMALPLRGNEWKCGAFTKIILREGEGMALVSSAETATAATAVGMSGWIPFDIAITFSVEAAFVPSLTVAGVQTGSDVVILAAGSQTVLADGQEISGTTFAFSSDDPVYIDVGVFKPGYVPLYIRNYYLSAPNVTLPVAQVVDRAYIE